MMGDSDTAVLEPLGYIGYGAFNKTIYDYPGLSSKIVVNTLKSRQQRGMINLIAILQPSFLVLRPSESKELMEQKPDVAKKYRKVAHIQAEKNVSFEKWGYSIGNQITDGDFTIYQRITPLAHLGPQTPVETVAENLGKCPASY